MVEAVINIISILITLLQWAIIIRALLSFLPMAGVRLDPYNPLIRFLYSITDPILDPLRRYTAIGMIDLSPLVAIIVLDLLRTLLLAPFGGHAGGIFF